MRAYKVTRPSLGTKTWCVYRTGQDLIDGEFSDAEPGDRIVVELVEMTAGELDNLPEFAGW